MAKTLRTSAAYTTEFHHEFRAETGRLLRTRFLWFTAIVGMIAIGLVVGGIASALLQSTPAFTEAARGAGSDWQYWTLSVLLAALYASSFAYAYIRRPRDEQLLQLSIWLITVDGLLYVLMRAWGFEGNMPGLLTWFFVKHLIACGFLPWNPWQALRPMAVVLAGYAVMLLVFETSYASHAGDLADLAAGPAGELPEAGTAPTRELHSLGGSIALIILSLFLAVPGTVLCWMRHSKRTQDFKLRFMSTRYSEMRRELVDARKIHESLFPDPIEQGPLRFTFEYEPMRQIGGDFLFAHRHRKEGGDGPLSVVLLDVTGHGIPAALTVNRLHGELERVFAENPDIHPGEVLRLLNRYVHLTLASHSIYVTALCLRVCPDMGTVEYASGGHPPAFLRAVDGTVEELTSTAFVLGACPDEAFDAGPRSLTFGPGDSVLAYTDGAIEARNDSGKMIRIEGIRRMVASADGIPPTKWPNVFGHEVTEFRGGPAEDDTLLLVVHRVVGDRSRRATATSEPAQATT